MAPFVKICGVRTAGDVAAAVSAGADAVGFVFAASPRRVDVKTALELGELAGDLLTVGVFLGMPAGEVRAIATAAKLRAVQLHGDYDKDTFTALADPAWQLVRAVPSSAPDLRVGAYGEDLLLVDAPKAGSGESWDYHSVAGLPGQWILAGGLTPENAAAARDTAGAWGVDVSSGVESSRGVKDATLIARFVEAVKG
ncbi:phosphoribosylanthranilate isomerase [Actinophytocola oryzae]|uniref:N-(5'-phosphoribosyl)anthranilate isomerase n=1 Tax=Actinophytocola oryzae TaxID=502181 RepID=A0A4R7VD12_9PSEU|nr:phosphoribosylanthranilate isomerase [Actinophytocola oryzae]TDV46859.1 phosphoribosylanthranilate isomerase [Actinophytocola oryzae]